MDNLESHEGTLVVIGRDNFPGLCWRKIHLIFDANIYRETLKLQSSLGLTPTFPQADRCEPTAQV